MARVHGKNVNYSFNGVAIEGDLDQVVMNVAVPEGEITSFSDAYQNFLAGKKNVKMSIEGTYNPAVSQIDATLFAAIEAAAVSTIFDPTGDGPAANDPEFQCTASGLTGVLIDSIEITIPVNGPARISAELQHSGSTTR